MNISKEDKINFLRNSDWDIGINNNTILVYNEDGSFMFSVSEEYLSDSIIEFTNLVVESEITSIIKNLEKRIGNIV